MRSTGFAHIRDGDKAPTWGVFEMPNWAGEEGRRLWEWFSWLGHLATEKQISHLFMERPIEVGHHEDLTENVAKWGQVGMADAVVYLCGLRGHVVDGATTITSSQWRPPFIGSETPPLGLAKHQRRKWLKDKSVAACHVRGWMVEGNDAADALGILTFGVTTIDPRFAVQQGPLFRRQATQCDNEARAMR